MLKFLITPPIQFTCKLLKEMSAKCACHIHTYVHIHVGQH